MSTPITPAQALAAREKSIPAFVVEAFNELIVEKLASKVAYITQDEVVELILKKAASRPEFVTLTREDIFARHWLDVEPRFREAGWKVEFYKPDRGDVGVSRFVFSMVG